MPLTGEAPSAISRAERSRKTLQQAAKRQKAAAAPEGAAAVVGKIGEGVGVVRKPERGVSRSVSRAR